MSPLDQDLALALEVLDAHHAKDVYVRDVRNRSTVFDTLIVCTGTSTRHVQSLAKYIQAAFKPHRDAKPPMEGYTYGRWVLVDCDTILVHVMQAEERDYYQLEALWDASEASSP